MTESPVWAAWLLVAVFAGFVMDWLAVAFNWVKIKPFTKISAILLLILWTLTAGSGKAGLMLVMLILAQGFGLAGDAFLLLSSRWFMWGLGAFLAGNLFYISLLAIRFSSAIQSQTIQESIFWRLFLSLAFWGFMMVVFYRFIYFPIKRKYLSLSFKASVQFYAIILSIMVAFSFLIALSVHQPEGFIWALPIGSALFILSDAILAYNRFVKKVPQGQLWVRITYHTAQFLLAWGFLQFI